MSGGLRGRWHVEGPAASDKEEKAAYMWFISNLDRNRQRRAEHGNPQAEMDLSSAFAGVRARIAAQSVAPFARLGLGAAQSSL